VLIECDDSLDSINATASAIVRYVSQRAGIGINAGRIRGLGSPIRGGEAFHTGCIPFYKYFQTAVKCCSQGACAAVRPPCSTRCGTPKWKACWY
jgi:ribonucleoside-diphosphate reductase alpha chain